MSDEKTTDFEKDVAKCNDDFANSSDCGNSQIDEMINFLDDFANSSESRLKINMSDEVAEGERQKVHHHGRCDIGSPFACGNAFNTDTER